MRYGLVVVALLAAACRGRAGASEAPRTAAADAAAMPGSSSTAYDDWYPNDITPPAGTQYHLSLIHI